MLKERQVTLAAEETLSPGRIAESAGGTKASNPQSPDWFFSAITSAGPVDQCFATVLTELERRNLFVKSLRQTMRAENTTEKDLITLIGERIRSLENTLSFRLGILSPEREAPWFRHPSNRSAGPFASSILTEPVFAQYDSDKVADLRIRIKQLWTRHECTALPFRSDSPCLWRTLLKLNADHEQAMTLSQPFESLRLDRLPDGLPLDMDSPSLRAFLINVRAAAMQNRKRLNDCFRSLWSASDSFWDAQKKVSAKRATAEYTGPHKEGATSKDQAEKPRGFRAAAGAQEVRDEFRRRRKEQQQSRAFMAFSHILRDALEFMGFDELPSPEILKKRYISLAKKHHPDCDGGDEDAFKQLAKAYDLLCDRVGAPR